MTGTRDEAQALRCVSAVGAAYLVQGIVAAVGALLVGVLAQTGTPIEQQAGLLASGAVPWVLKCVGALVFDLGPSWPMRLRAMVLAGLQLCAAACLWTLAAAWAGREAGGTSSLGTIATAWVALNFAAALQDVLVDNLALDTLRGRQTWTATAMGTGHAIGMGLLGSLVLGETIAERGMVEGLRQPAYWVATAAVSCAVLVWMPGRPDRTSQATPRDRLPSPNQLLALLGLLLLFAALLLGANLTTAVSAEFLFGHLRVDLLEYTRVLLPIATIAGIVGAIGMGPLVAKRGPARASMIAGGALGLVWLAFAGASPLWHAAATIPSLAGLEAPLPAALLVGLHAIALLAAARSPMPTTAFVLAMAAINLPRALAPLCAPTLVQLGWVGVFAACGAIQLLAVAGLWPLRRLGRDP